MIRKIRSMITKWNIRLNQKKYKKLTYLYQSGKSDTLVVSFSGFAGNASARYNYINTLCDLNAHRLFILDDFGYEKQGSYYLGEDGNWFLPEMIVELIDEIRSKNNIDHLVMIGSSKGGTAALYYSIKTNADYCVIGAPQYFIGDYLSIDRHLPIMKGIMGNAEPESVQKLNDVIKNCINSATSPKPQVFIHYSPSEHTYQEHIVDMISNLKANSFEVFEDSDYDYSDHSDVAKHFPAYLIKTLNANIK